jgi:glutathione S-transferase
MADPAVEIEMKLYYSPNTCATADHIVLEWIGRPHEAVKLSREDRAKPAFRALNPAGAVPVLEHDGWILTQNAAILGYLLDLHPESRLGGDGSPKARAEVNRWLAFVNSDVHPAFKPLFGATAYLEASAVEATKAQARATLRALFARADAQLASRDWLTGTRSIADPYLYVTLRWARANGVDLAGFHALARFVRTMESDAGVQRVLAAEGLGPA